MVGALGDSQRHIENAYKYFHGRFKNMAKRVSDPRWKFQLKYSTSVTKRCVSDQDEIAGFEAIIDNGAKTIANHMGDVL
jgi:hypothetical protein